MNLAFVYTKGFLDDWDALGLTDEHARWLELQLMARPDAGDVMQATGGVRKTRFALPGKGRSGSVRVIYAYFRKHSQVYFLVAFGKSEKANLSSAEKQMCRELMSQISSYLETKGKK